MMRIVETTDGQNIGFVFDEKLSRINLPSGMVFEVTKVTALEQGVRFSNSNYVVDAEVANG